MFRRTKLWLLVFWAALVLAGPAAEAQRPGARRARTEAISAGKGVRKLSTQRPETTRKAARISRLGRRQAAPDRAPVERSAKQAAAQIRPGHHVYVPVGHSVAKSVLRALGARANKESALNGDNPVHIVGLTNTASSRLFDSDKIVPKSVFIGANSRNAIAAGRGSFVPTHLSRVPRLIREGTLPVDVALIQVSPPDKDGYVTLGATAAATLAAMDKAKTIIAEVNPNVPRTWGATRFHQNRIDYMVRSDEPLVAVDPPEITRTDKQIAEHVLSLIPRDPTLQFGIGATTDAVAGLLADTGRKDLRVHSEMISDGTMRLVNSGAVKGKVKYSFAFGSQEMLRWMDNNRKLVSETTDKVNDPVKLSRIERLISINTALRVDLNGQVNAQYVGKRYYSGIGGQQDFFRGAMLSPGGRAILALPSTSMVKGKDGKTRRESRITFQLGADDIVTTSMHDVQYVVTEYGVAHIDGKSSVERARALIEIAHPSFRKELRKKLERQLDERRAEVDNRGLSR